MYDFSLCKIFAQLVLHMNLNQSCGIDACQGVVQDLYLLSLKFTVSAYQTEMMHTQT
jgi:hypothetical protein